MGRHRAISSRRTPVRSRAGRPARTLPGAMVCGAATAMIVTLGGVAATAPGSVAAMPVELSALVVVGSSTNPTGDGVRDFYRGKFDRPDSDVVTVDFFGGPLGLYRVLDEGPADDTVVLSSGWGAANTSLLLTYLAATGSQDPVLTGPRLYVLDNNVASPNGGYGTRLPWFALLGVNPLPTPSAPGVRVVNVVYEYDINSNIPAYVLNGPAMANSLIAYFQRRLNQQDLVLPVDEDGTSLVPADCAESCSVTTARDGRVDFTRVEQDRYAFTTEGGDYGYVEVVGDTTYVAYKSDGLPLVAPLRLLGEPGQRLADLTEPALEAVVRYGYPDNDPLANPDTYVPARLIPTVPETRRFVRDFADGVVAGVATLDDPAATSVRRTDAGAVVGDDVSASVSTPTAGAAGRAPRPVIRHSMDFTPGRSAGTAGRRDRPAPLARTAMRLVETISTRFRRDGGASAETAGQGGAHTATEAPAG